MEMNDLYIGETNEITLVRKKRLPVKKIKHLFKPVYGMERFKVKMGKVGAKDQIAAAKMQSFQKLKPETIEANMFFSAWLINRLIKKVDPYWDKTDKQLEKMISDETLKEVTKIWLAAEAKGEKKTEQESQ